MPRPHITVTVTDAPPAINPGSLTATTFLGFASATGISAPVAVSSPREAAAAGVTAAAVQQVSDLVAEGASTIVLTRIPVAANALATTDDEVILAALNAAGTTQFGVGQVILPGISSTDAWSALLDHAKATGRTVLLDTDETKTPADLVTAVTALRTRQGAERAGVIAGGVRTSVTGGATRVVPGSIVAAGATARMDARAGHAGRVPAFTQEFGDAGLSYLGDAGATRTFSDAQLDALADGGIIPILDRPAGPTIYDFVSLSNDEDWTQLNFGRLAMQVAAQAGSFLEQYLGRQIDGRGHLFASMEGGLDGSVFLPLWQADAFYGDTASDAYTVQVAGITTPAEVAAGTIHAAGAVTFTRGARKVQFDVTVRRPGAEGAAA